MKLSKIALSVIALVGIAGVGGSYFTGKQAEQRYPNMFAQANLQLKRLEAQGIKAEFKDLQFERHWFSSEAKYVFEINADSKQYRIQGEDTLYHGPFPLNRLQKGNIIPMAISGDSRMIFPDELKDLINNQTAFLNSHTNLSYTGNLTSVIHTQPLKSTSFEMAATETQLDGKLSGDLFSGLTTTVLPKLKFTDNNITIEVDNLAYKANLAAPSDFVHLDLGTLSATIDNIAIKNNIQRTAIAYQNIRLNGNNNLKGERYEGDANINFDLVLSTPTAQTSLGKLTFNSLMESDAKLTNEFNAYLKSFLLERSPQSFEKWHNLVKKGIKIHITPLKLSNDQGELSLELVANGKPFETVATPSQALALLQKSHFKVKFDLPVIKGLINQMAQVQGATPEQASQQADYVVAELIHQLKQTQAVNIDDKQITADLQIDEGKVLLNGKALSDAEVQNALIMLMFSLNRF
ncbi:YdgA family protein [Muribacter muris]|nr:YdgA family protein [Muribacter muris]MBF0785681.1 YdgA family protein [Muribacter muris]MBF0828352.1 YdgA family protein [Muribacter muris]